MPPAGTSPWHGVDRIRATHKQLYGFQSELCIQGYSNPAIRATTSGGSQALIRSAQMLDMLRQAPKAARIVDDLS